MGKVLRFSGRLLRPNPVTVREMKARMRGPRAFALLGIYLAVLGLLTYMVYVRSGGGNSYSYGNPSQVTYGPTKSFEIGQNLFITIFMFLIFVMALVAPALTGGAISREVEGRTYELLLVTPINRRSLIFGKFLSALLFVFFLALAAIPVACIVFIFGGVEPQDILAGYAIVLISGAAYAAIGAFFSSLIRRTGPAILVSYVVVALLVLGSQLTSSSIVTAINGDTNRFPAGSIRPDPRTDPAFDFPKRILVFSPLASIGSVLTPNAPFRPNNTDDLQYFPASTLFGGNPNTYYRQGTGGQFAQNNALARQPILPNGWALWGAYVLVYSGILALFLLLSIAVARPERSVRHFRLPFRKPRQARPTKVAPANQGHNRG